jgi:S-adenosylmethionine hydrolase
MASPLIIFLTDYGLADPFVGVCHAVIAGRCPEARVIDLSHGIPPQDVRAGAVVLVRALPFLPAGVLLAVVDPGVGGPRRGVAIEAADGRLLVGPDNGLLWPAALASGGATAAMDLAGSPFSRKPVSATFHGRDVFAPVAAALASGTALERVGVPVDPATLVTLEESHPELDAGVLRARVAAVDHFGNLELGAAPSDLDAAGLSRCGELVVEGGKGPARARRGRTFADVRAGQLLLYEDSGGALALAVRGGSAALCLAAAAGEELRITAP